MVEMLESLILIGIEALGCDLFFQTFFKERYDKKRWLHILIILLLVAVWMIFAIYIDDTVIRSVCGTVIMAMNMLVFYREKIGKIFFCAVCYEAIVLSMDMGLLAIFQHFMGGTLKEILDIDGKITPLWVLFKLILFLCVIAIYIIFSQDNALKLKNTQWGRFFFFPIFTVMAVVFILLDKAIASQTAMFLSFGLLLTNIFLFYLIRDSASKSEKNRKTSLILEQRQNQIETYESMELSYNLQKRKVHEFKNHLDCIQGLLQENKEREALAYISKINNLTEQHMNYFNTLNPVADVVINQKYQQAQANGITMVTVLDELNEIPMKDKDLVVLLSNLLNNAIEACQNLEIEKRMIKFKFKQDREQIIISVRNPINEPITLIDNRVNTTKTNKKEHGIGFYNIEEVIDKYHGDGTCSSTQDEFSYTIIFDKEQMHSVY